jgi:hypothetical protein
MSRHRRRVASGAAVAVAVAVLAGCTAPEEPTVTVGTAQTLAVEVADSPEERRVGLMGRTDVPEGTGMAFVYPEPLRGGFWMRDTLVPLSIVWVLDDTVVGVAEMEPCADREQCLVYYPEDADAVFDLAVEAAAGTFTEAGVRPGDPVSTTGLPGR